jgi:class 3 adenylate cyclase
MVRRRLGEAARWLRRPDDRRRVRAAWFVPFVLVTLVLSALLPLLFVGWRAVDGNTARLLAERYDVTVDRVADALDGQVAPIERACPALARLLAAGGRDRARDAVEGLRLAAPQVRAVSSLPPGDPPTAWSFGEGPVATYRCAVDGRGAAITLSLRPLSAALARFGDSAGLTPFLLLGRDQVLAHPDLAAEIAIDTADPVLAMIWEAPRPLNAARPLRRSQGHWRFIGWRGHTFIYRDVAMDGAPPLLLGFHMTGDGTRGLRLVRWLLLACGLVTLVMAAAAAARLGRALAAPATAFAESAAAFEQLDFHNTAHARLASLAEENRILETSAAARAMARMAAAISVFEAYVPRTIVRQLIAAGPAAAKAEERVVTLLFLDLEGYTGFARGRPPADVAAALNGFFALVGPPIEATGGTIDKYTGDGLLAFWGAPSADPAHAAHALDAVERIAVALASQPQPLPCRLRAGLHSATVLVGPLGYRGRLNYTVVGRGVNFAQRIQAALRGVAPGEQLVIGASDGFLAAAAPGARYLRLPIAAAVLEEAVWRLVPRD